MKLTKQQDDIIISDFYETYISARAGTGKTTTLVEYARKRPFSTFLYIVYNNPVRKESKRKFFGNTEVHTIHSLAYKQFGYLYENKLTSNIRVKDIINAFPELQARIVKNDETVYSFASKIVEILEYFFNSSIENLIELDGQENNELDYAIEYWDMMQRLNNLSVKMTHDGYLKAYQLTKPKLNYDYIMVDEAQDSNEVMLDIVMRQKAKKIFVGDMYQEIYGYRKTINIFKDKEISFYLTESFRFGEQIAFVANSILKKYKNESILIHGTRAVDSISIFGDDEPYTLISRTNANQFDLAIQSVLNNKSIHIIGADSFMFENILDAYYLFTGNRYQIKNIYIKDFKTFDKMKSISDSIEDLELKFLVRLIEKYKELIPEYVFLVKRALTKESSADIVLTTAHKSKGREFFKVKIADDFVSLFRNDILIPPHLVNNEEMNIYYVAVSRAMESIQLNKELDKMLVF